jgi:hypothetical protein
MFNRTSTKRETATSKQIQAASLSLASANSRRGITRREAINRTSTSSRSTIGRSLSLGRRGILAALNGEEVAPQSPSNNGGSTSFMKVLSTKLSGPPLKTTASTNRRTKPNQTKLEHSEVSPGAAAAAIKTAERVNHHRRSSRQHEFQRRSTLTTASLSSSSGDSFSSGSRSISPPPRRRARSKSRPMSPSPYQRRRGTYRQPTLSPPPRRPLSLHRNKGTGESRSRKRSVTPSPRSSGSRRVEDVLPPRSREQPRQGRSRKVEGGGGGGGGEGERSRMRRRSPPPAPPPGYLNWRKGDANRRFQNDTAMRQVSPHLRRSASNGRSLPSMSRLPPPPPPRFCVTSDEDSPPNKATTVFRRYHSDSFPVNGGVGAPKSGGDKGVVQRRHSAEGTLGHGIMTLPPPSPPPRTQPKVLRSQYAYKQLLAMATAKQDVGSGSVSSQEFELSDEKSKTSDSEESPRSLTNWVNKRCSDINGFTGKYIGEVNSEGLMHGFGIMFYDFGLQHDGIWVNGLWEEATRDVANWNLTGQSTLGTSQGSSRDGAASMVSSLSPSIKQIQMNHMMTMQRQLRSTVQGVGCPLTPPPKQIIVPGQQHQGEVQTQDESNGMNQFKHHYSLEGSPEVHLPMKPPAPVEQDNRPPPLTEIKVKVKMPPPPPKQQQEQERDSSNPASSVSVPPPPTPKLETISSIHEKGQDNSSSIAEVRAVQVPPPPKRTTKESSSTDDQEQEQEEDGDVHEEATYDNIMLAATKWLVRVKHIDREGEGECVDIPKEVTYNNLERAKKWLSGSKQMDQEEEQDGRIPEEVTYNSLVLAAAAMTDTEMMQSVCSGTLTKNS